MKLGHLGIGGLTLAGAIAVGAAIDATPAHAQAQNCPAAGATVMKTLRISPKAVLPRDIRLACIRTGGKPALASRNLLGGFIGKMKIQPGPLAIGDCVDALLYTSATAGLPAAYANLKDIATACQRAKDRPALASRNFSHRFVVTNKLEAAPAAPADLAKICTGRVTAISTALKLNPKIANAKDLATACKIGKGRPVLTMRNYLDRFVVAAKIAPSVRKPAAPAKPPACPVVLTNVSKTLALSPKFANKKDIGTACQRAKGRPALATSNVLNRFVATFKITPDKPKPAPAAVAKSCVGKLTEVTKLLRIDPKFANAKDIAKSCRLAKGKRALASRNFTGRFVKAAGIK